MRTLIVLTMSAFACLTVTYSFVRGSNIAFDSVTHEQEVEAAFKAAWAAGKKDEASREKLAWLCCETRRYTDARKFLTELQQLHERGAQTKYDAAYSKYFSKRAQVDLCEAKFADALKLFEAQLAYDLRYLPPKSIEVKKDRNNIATAEILLAQTVAADHVQRDAHRDKAAQALEQARQTSSDGPHDLMMKQNALVLAQQTDDRSEIELAKRDAELARKRLRITVPVAEY